MNRFIRLLLGLLASVVLLIADAPRPVRADGGVFPPSHSTDVEMPAQKAIIVYDAEKGHEDLILSIDLLSSSRTGGPGPVVVPVTPTTEEDAASAAWVVPLPSLPEVKATSSLWFSLLSNRTRPEVKYHEEIVYEQVIEKEIEKETTVELLSREQVGIYDVSILSADESMALLEWLNEHGYAFPEEGEPLLDLYMKEAGWYFVAARITPGEKTYFQGDVQPLWFSFETERPIYPMRLTSVVENDIDVLIYALTDHRMEVTGFSFETEFAGELTLPKVSQETNQDLVDLLTHRPYYVTKLHCEHLSLSELTDDLYLDRAASDEPYRLVLHRKQYRYRPKVTLTSSPTATITPRGLRLESKGWLGLWLGLALIGLLAGLGLVWRRRLRRKSDEEKEA